MQLSYQEQRAMQGQPIVLAAKAGPLGRVRDLTLHEGDTISFSTRNISARGTVLSIDHGAAYPIKVEWLAADNKRLTSFHPDEFISIIKEQ